MSTPLPPNVKAWLVEPLSREVLRAIERTARAPDVRHVAIMPDVHLAHDVCVGTVVATERLIYPAAVGSDIGCGIAAIAFDGEAAAAGNEAAAREILEQLSLGVPIHRHRAAALLPELEDHAMSDATLDTIRRRDGTVQFGTLGRGNHFLEFQSDEDGRLWLMVHSGSRAVGQAIRDFHESRALPGGLRSLEADSRAGMSYLSDLRWARDYARASRKRMIQAAAEVARRVLGVEPDRSSLFDCDHNHVVRESHFGKDYWVHRKGAMSATEDEAGAIPGSMGTESFHVAGRAHAASLRSSSHGAGRAMSRDEARRSIRPTDLRRQMEGVFFSGSGLDSLRKEAPDAYKDVRKVLRAEKELTRAVRRLKPVLVYKGT